MMLRWESVNVNNREGYIRAATRKTVAKKMIYFSIELVSNDYLDITQPPRIL